MKRRFQTSLSIAFAATLLGVVGCTDSSSGSSASSSGPKTITAGLNGGDFDLIVGHSHHVQEAMTDQGAAIRLIQGRMGKTFDPRATIEDAYKDPSYEHFGNDGEQPMPMCKVLDQDPVPLAGSDDALQEGSPIMPVTCALDDGTTLYVTAWEK